MRKLLLPICLLSISTLLLAGIKPAVAQTILGKTICGYQGWFNCYGDGSPVARWFHWSNGTYQSNTGMPTAGAIKFEVFPDISEYTPADLYTTGFAPLGNGSVTKLFSSYKPNVIDKHFEWMQQYGIDGVALQRFISETFDGVFKANRDSVATRVKRSAEKHQRIFYLMYDISGMDVLKFDSIKTDWQNNMVGKLHLTSSDYYLYQDAKPVVCLWGFGFTDRPGDAAQCLDVINWFKAQGCYVIGGVPSNWRTCTSDSKTGFENVYKAYDMISPWSVGRFGNNTDADNFKTNYLVPDLAYCNTNGLAYQPVAFPGFAWSNWNGGTKNQIPRNKGQFLWKQVENIYLSGISCMYVAMFDEYDEGTAIAKMGDSYFDVPTDQYFLTTSADGTYLSSDFYLRLVGEATRVINNTSPFRLGGVPIPYSVGPLWFRSSFENTLDAMPNWVDSNDPSTTSTNIIGYGGSGNPECSAVQEPTKHVGNYALRYSGRDNSTSSSFASYRVFDVDIPVNGNSVLSYWAYPQTDLARYMTVDLVCTDGTKLTQTTATDKTGISMNTGAKGTINQWTEIECHIGSWLNGKTIDRIILSYNHDPETGDFRGYIDDVLISEETVSTGVSTTKSIQEISVYPNPVTGSVCNLVFPSELIGKKVQITIFDLYGKQILAESILAQAKTEISLFSLPSGIYIVSFADPQVKRFLKIIKE